MSARDAQSDDFVELGFISGIHGVKGWVKVFSFTQPREAILDYQPWLLGEERKPVTLVSGSKHGKSVIAQLPGVEDRDQARSLIEQRICVERGRMPELPRDVYYWTDLEGLVVFTGDGVELGQVERMMETGAHDVMVLRGDRERLIPFVTGDIVRKVDLASGTIVVDWDPEY